MPAIAEDFAEVKLKGRPEGMNFIIAMARRLIEDPRTAEWAEELIRRMAHQVIEASKLRGKAAQTRGMLHALRDGARSLEVNGADKNENHAALWIQRADKIELRVQLAEALPRTPKKKALSELRAEAEELLMTLGKLVDRSGTDLARFGS